MAFAGSLCAQGGAGMGKGGWPGGGKQGQGGQGGQGGAPGQGGGQGGGNWEKEQIDKIGWGEDGTEERVLPGQTVDDKAKDERLEKEADKLGLEDKKIRSAFKKYAKQGWDAAEREDKRWAGVRKPVASDEKKLADETKKHQEKLAKAWEDSDADMKKKETLNEEKLEEWKKNSADLRKETATDKSARQDEIRARKIQEIRDAATKWVKEQQGGGAKEEPKEKKEKKEEEDK